MATDVAEQSGSAPVSVRLAERTLTHEIRGAKIV
jgi:hypothetical protein